MTNENNVLKNLVAKYMGKYHAQPDDGTRGNWVDGLDAALEDGGFELGDRPDGSDPWDLVHVYIDNDTVASVCLSDESRSHDDPYRYDVVPLVEIDD